jgi:hypothetical protein
MTYLWLDGLPIDVELNPTGQPQRLIWNKKKHTVHRILNRWILHDRWWSEQEQIWRDYYYLTTRSGLLLIIFQNVLSQSWFLYKLFD